MTTKWTSIVLSFCASLRVSMPLHAAAAQTIGPNVNLTKASGNQYETSVAIDPNDANHIFIVGRNELGGLSTARSTDGGITWTKKLFGAANPPAGGDVPRAYGNASVAWDVFGNLFLAYLSQNSSTSQFLYVTVAVSADGGTTFHAPTGVGPAIILPYNQSPYSTGDQPTITVGPGSGGFAGSVWVTYFSVGGIWVSGAGVSGLDAVGSFASQPLPDQPTGNFGDIAVGPGGEVIVTFGPVSAASGTIYTAVDPDGLGLLPFSGNYPAVSVNIGGFTYIPAQPNWGIDPEAGLAFDRGGGTHNGRVYLVYTDRPAMDSYDTNIFVMSSDDRGVSWSVPVRVNDDVGGNSQFLPHISLDQSTGWLAVTWYDARNSSTNDTTQYFGAISSDGGATFGTNFQISSGTSDQAHSIAALKKADYGDYTGNAFAGGRLVPAWADNSNSTADNPDGATNFDMYTAIVAVDVPVDSIPPVLAPTLSTSDAPLRLYASVTASPNAVDSGSGVKTATCDPVDTASPGAHTVACTATDFAGNTASATLDYIVGFTVSNVVVSPEGVVRAGSVIEVTFQLVDANSQPIPDAMAKGLGCAVTATLGSASPVCVNYNPSKDRFDLKLKISPKLAAGAWPLSITVMEGQVLVASAVVVVNIR